MERLIYFFYIFFQGILFFQVIVFFYIWKTSGKKELLYYSLFLLLIAVNFLISDPSTFGLGKDEVVLKSSWFKLINTPLVISANIFYVLFLSGFYKTLTDNRHFFSILYIVKTILLFSLFTFLLLFTLGIHSDLLFNIINFLGVIAGIWLVTIIIREKMPYTRQMAWGFIANLVGTLASVCMLILLTQGVKHLLVSEYPFVFVKLGVLIEVFFFNMAIFKKWSRQEKDLAIQHLETQLAVEKVRNEISKELHDDIGSTLSGINMYSHMAKQQRLTGQEKESQNSLHIIQQASDEMIHRLKDLVWVMQPGHDTLEQLLNKIKEFAEFITGAKQVNLHTDFTNLGASIKISTEARHHIFTIAKEVLNNAVKYSDSPDIFITATTNNNYFTLQIKDNGKGFEITQSTGGNGLINIRSRALDMGGKLELQSIPETGTIMTLILKITQKGIA